MRRAPLLLLLLFMCLPTAGHAQPRKLLIVVMDRVAWQDLRAHESDAPTFWDLAAHSAVGAMGVRTAGGPDGNGSYLTLGAGSRANAGGSLYQPGSPEGEAFNADEAVGDLPAASAYRARTGRNAGGDAIVHLGVGELAWQNASPSYPLELGLLGATLRTAGLHIACFGNADTARGLHREVVALAMDGTGRVQFGDVGADLLAKDDSLPAGYRTDPDRLAAALARVAPETDLAVVDLGETSRVDEYLQSMPPTMVDAALSGAIQRADHLLAKVLTVAPPEQWTLLLLAPAAPSSSPTRQYASFTPVLLHTPDGRTGLLTSPSTRRAGLVTSTDIAASVLSLFGLREPRASVGRAFQVVPSVAALGSLEHDLARQDALETSRRPIFRGFATYAAVVLWLCVLWFIFGDRLPVWTRPLLRGLLLVALAVPSSALLLALWPDALTPTQQLSTTVALGLALALAASMVTRWRHADGALAATVVVLLALDLLLGERMQHWSTLSYSAAAGARFYGIGNEYGGAMMGASLVGAVAFLNRLPRVRFATRGGLTAALLVVLLLIGWPRLGANFGMALSCAVGFTVFGIYLWRGRFRWIDLAAIAVAALAVAALVVAVDAVATRGASHVGLLVATMRAEGPEALADVIGRKLAMSWTLLRVSIWTGMAIGAVAFFLTALLFRPPAILEALRRRAWLLPALIAVFVGAAAALVLNDSGVLAAAIALLYGAGALAYAGLARPSVPRRRPRALTLEVHRSPRAD